MRAAFEEFGDHPCLEQGASLRMDEELLRALDSDQVGGKAGIVEIELWGLGEAFTEVPMVGWKQVHDVTGLEHRDPRLCGVVCDSAVVSESGKIQ